jgi:hypothetical protein
MVITGLFTGITALVFLYPIRVSSSVSPTVNFVDRINSPFSSVVNHELVEILWIVTKGIGLFRESVAFPKISGLLYRLPNESRRNSPGIKTISE